MRLRPVLLASLAFLSASIVFTPGMAAAEPAPRAREHITISRSNGDGTTSVRLYTFAAGSRGAREFKAPAGWQRVTHAAQATAAAVCRYGDTPGLGDNPLIYPCIRWGFAGFSDPQVYFRDHTPSAWPVKAAVAEWHKTVGIDSYWMWESTACPAATTGKHCVNVWAGAYGTDDLAAWTDYSYDDRSNRFIDGTVKIYFNTSFSHGGTAEHRYTACHELGHALGVGHNQDESEGSCMGPVTYPLPSGDQYPGSNDRGLLTYVVYP